MLAHKDGLLNLGLLNVALLPHLDDALPVGGGDHLIVLHLLHLFLDLLIVTLFEFHNFASTLTCLFNLFPRLHFLLLEQGDTIRQKLSVTLHTIEGKDKRGGEKC